MEPNSHYAVLHVCVLFSPVTFSRNISSDIVLFNKTNFESNYKIFFAKMASGMSPELRDKFEMLKMEIRAILVSANDGLTPAALDRDYM